MANLIDPMEKTETLTLIAKTTIRKNDCGEYVVRAYGEDGKRIPGCDYYATDKDDAFATSCAMVLAYQKAGQASINIPYPSLKSIRQETIYTFANNEDARDFANSKGIRCVVVPPLERINGVLQAQVYEVVLSKVLDSDKNVPSERTQTEIRIAALGKL